MVLNLLKSSALGLLAQQNSDNEVFTPNPGSLSSTLYVPSLNNILQLAAPLAANELFQKKTYNPNINEQSFAYSVEIDTVHFNSVDGFDLKDLSFVNGTDTLQLSLGGINIDAEVVGTAKAIDLIPCSIDAIKITNFTMIVGASTTSDDDVHYTLGLDSWF